MDNVGMQNLLLTPTQANPSLTQEIKEQSKDFLEFELFMGKAENENEIQDFNVWSESKKDFDVTTQFAKESSTSTGDKVAKKQPEPVDRTKAESTKSKIDDAASKVKDVLKEELHVTEEEIEDAMEALGFANADLFFPENLAQIVVALSEDMDSISLLSDLTFKDILMETAQITEELLPQLPVEAEEILGYYENLEKLLTPVDEVEAQALVEEFDSLLQGMADDLTQTQEKVLLQDEGFAKEALETVGIAEEAADASVNSVVTANIDDNPQGEDANEMFDRSKDLAAEVLPEDTAEETTFKDIEEDALDGIRVAKDDGKSAAKPTERSDAPVVSQTVTMDSQTGEVVTETVTRYLSPGQTTEIITQIARQASVTINQDVTTMQMQLSPASLGHILLNVSSKQGTVTAQLIAQDEAVKQALETQVAELRESLEARGIKVQAIEITVSAHAFERNLEQNNRQDEERQDGGGERRTRRNLKTDGLDELQGLMSEEESLLARIMVENGNSMDVTA